MSDGELVEAEDVHAAHGEVEEGGGAHGAEANDQSIHIVSHLQSVSTGAQHFW